MHLYNLAGCCFQAAYELACANPASGAQRNFEKCSTSTSCRLKFASCHCQGLPTQMDPLASSLGLRGDILHEYKQKGNQL